MISIFQVLRLRCQGKRDPSLEPQLWILAPTIAKTGLKAVEAKPDLMIKPEQLASLQHQLSSEGSEN